MKVNDEFRRNSLSTIPGGSSVTVRHSNGNEFTYDKIKNIKAYVNVTKKNPSVVLIKSGETILWQR